MKHPNPLTDQSVVAPTNEGRLQALLSSAVDGIIVIRADGQIETVNPAAARLFGYEVSEFIGRNVRFLMTDEHRVNHDSYLRNYRTTGHRKVIGIGREVQGRRKDGSVFPMHLSVGEFDEGGEKLFTGIIHDLTQRMEAEHALRQAQKIEAIGQLTGGVAHDFNNLLTVIIGNLELLMLEPELKRHQRSLDAIMKAAELGESLTSRLLAFARRTPLEPKSIDLNKLILDLTQMLERVIGTSISLSTSLDQSAWTVKVDPDQFQTALVNLAINARDAMPHGGRLVVETWNFQMDQMMKEELKVQLGNYVAVSVTDTGCGMSQDVVHRVFEPFYTTKPVGAGTGLGLSMVYGFTKQSGGDVTIYSQVGKGTTVNLFLPRHMETEPLTARSEPVAPVGSPSGETVLVVEDNDQVRLLMQARLEALGYGVIVANHGPAAVVALKTHPGVDLVLTDLVMPGGMSGYEVAEHVQSHYPHIPVLITSGYAEELVNRDNLASQNLKLLRKPVRQFTLAQAIRDAIEHATTNPKR